MKNKHTLKLDWVSTDFVIKLKRLLENGGYEVHFPDCYTLEATEDLPSPEELKI